MSNNTVRKGKRWIAMNTRSGAIHIVIASNYWDAFERARKWFGKTPLHVVQDRLSTR